MTTDHRCPSCKMRHRIPPPSWRVEHYNAMNVDVGVIRLLRYAATFFDDESDGPHTAREFVDWLVPDLRGQMSIPEAVGKSLVEGGGRKGGGAVAVRHSAPDPLPLLRDPRSAA